MNTIDVCIRDDFEDGSGTAIEVYHFNVEDAEEFLSDIHDFIGNLEGDFGEILTSGEAKGDLRTSMLINDILQAGTAKDEKHLELYTELANRVFSREEIEEVVDTIYKRADMLRRCADTFASKMNQS